MKYLLSAIVIVFCCCFFSISHAKVIPCPILEDSSYKSNLYEIQIEQDKIYPSFVWVSNNNYTSQWPYNRTVMSDNNHWTSFSFDGGVKVKINNLTSETIKKAIVKPASKNIECIIENNVITFSITEPGQFTIIINDNYKEPVFVFANNLEISPPEQEKENLFFFGPGIHDIGVSGILLSENQSVYLSEGSIVRGTIKIQDGAQNVKIFGRGILSGDQIPEEPTWSKHMISGGKGCSVSVEGITITDPPKSIIELYGPSNIQNVKMFGWYDNSDGTIVGSNSLVENCFYKVMDDVLHNAGGNNIMYRNIIVWHQVIGSVIQISWQVSHNRGNNTFENIDVIRQDRTAGTDKPQLNNCLVRCMNIAGDGTIISNLVFRNIRVEGPSFSFVRLENQNSNYLGMENGKNAVQKNYLFEDIYFEKAPKEGGFINEDDGEISNITFKNVYYGEDCLNNATEAKIQIIGDVDSVRFIEDKTTSFQYFEKSKINRNDAILNPIINLNSSEPIKINLYTGTNLDQQIRKIDISVYDLSGKLIVQHCATTSEFASHLEVPVHYLFSKNSHPGYYITNVLISAKNKKIRKHSRMLII